MELVFSTYRDQLKNLEKVQSIDLKIDSLKVMQKSFEPGLKIIEKKEHDIHSQILVEENFLLEKEKNKNQIQAALKLHGERLLRSESRLDQIKNIQEYQSIQKEIDQLKKLIHSLKEQEKNNEQESLVIQEKILFLEEEKKTIHDQKEKDKITALRESEIIEKEIQFLLQERIKYMESVDQKIMQQYNRIRQAKGGQGVSLTVQGKCGSCSMMLPPQLFNDLQKGTSLHTCPNCHRLLCIS